MARTAVDMSYPQLLNLLSHVCSCRVVSVCHFFRLRKLLSTSTAHPARENATRGLLLSHTENIVHGLSPAGLAADRNTPDQYQKSNGVSSARAAASGSSRSRASRSGITNVESWRAHLQQLFASHGILSDSLVQRQIASTLQQQAGIGGVLSAADLHSALAAEAHTFGPQGAFWMETKRGGAQVRTPR